MLILRDIYIKKKGFWVPGMDPWLASSGYFGTEEPFSKATHTAGGVTCLAFPSGALTQPWAVMGHLTPACLEAPTLA